jgi:photosystem II stability/assembly factor-like uncharacterized protein
MIAALRFPTAVLLIILLFAVRILAIDGEWELLNGPWGGFMLSLSQINAHAETLYAGGDVHGGVYRSIDGGRSWMFTGMVSPLGDNIAVDCSPSAPELVLAGSEGGLYRSIDGGVTWQHAALPDTIVYAVAFDRKNDDLAYAGTLKEDILPDGYGIYRSTDRGATWVPSGLRDLPVISIAPHPDSTGTVIAGTGAGAYRSSDEGLTWTHLNLWAAVEGLAVDCEGTVYAGTRNDDADDGSVYRTSNCGASWDTLLVMGTTVYSVALCPGRPEIIYCAAGSYNEGNEGVYRTTDFGENWVLLAEGMEDRMARTVVTDPVDPSRVWSAADGLGGVYMSTDGGSHWESASSGMHHTLVQKICIDSSGGILVASGWGTYKDVPCIAKSTDEGESWIRFAPLPSVEYMVSTWDIAVHPEETDEIYVSGMKHTAGVPARGFICRNLDDGESWEELWRPDSLIVTSLSIHQSGEALRDDDTILAGVAGAMNREIYGVYRSTDRGSTWNPTDGWEEGNSVWVMRKDPFNPEVLFAGTTRGMYRSTDSGSSWIRNLNSPMNIYKLFVDGASKDMLYAGTGGPFFDTGGVYRSTDGGENWEKTGLDGYSICALTGISGPAGSTIFAGTGGMLLESPGKGIFASTDCGISWEPLNEGLRDSFILSMAVGDVRDIGVYAGTAGGGVYRFEKQQGIEKEDDEGKEKEGFDESLPDRKNPVSRFSGTTNPFNPRAEIRYSLCRESPVSLKIFNIRGALVKVLVEESRERGEHVVLWDGKDARGSDLPSGVYYCMMRSGDVRHILRLLLLR